MPALVWLVVLGMTSSVALSGDLSKYRNFQLGTDLAAVARAAGVNPSQAKVIHSRPALIQDLEWRPQPLGSSSGAESAKVVDFSFYNGELFRIVVNYDRYEIEGLTADDLAEAISETFGTPAKPTSPVTAAPGRDGDDEVLAQWQDSQYCFSLTRTSYASSFKLVGVLKRLEAPAQAAIVEATRLDDKEGPQREAARIAAEDQTARAMLEKARLLNKPKFRP